MRVVTVVWHGTEQESSELLAAITRNCDCKYGLMGFRISTCHAHRMLVEDQRALDGLLFARRMRARFELEELGPQQPIIEKPHYPRGPFKEPD